MDINRQRVDDWKNDIEQSVDFYNRWFLAFAPPAFRAARERARKNVDEVFLATEDGCSLHAAMLALAPTMLPVLRQMTCPPLARDRLAGLARVGSAVVRGMEDEGRKRAVRDTRTETVNIPVDVAILPRNAQPDSVPLFIEAKSAGDFANVNKRRKEEAQKIQQLKRTFGPDVRFVLFLCGYFDSGYLGYEAAEGIDWIWEHRMADMEALGL